MLIGEIDSIFFFGGGKLMSQCVRYILENNICSYVFAAKRHLDEKINKKETLQTALEKMGVDFFECHDVNKDSRLRKLVRKNSLGFGFGEVYQFNADLITKFDHRLFDFMVIDLPKYRGGAHFTWKILRSDDFGCWNIQCINEDMMPAMYDSGPVIMRREYSFVGASTPKEHFDISDKHGFDLFVEFVHKIKTGHEFHSFELDENQSMYFPRLNTEIHGYINWNWTGEEICRFISAFDLPYDGAITFNKSEKVRLRQCSTIEDYFHPFMAGLVYRINNSYAYLATKTCGICVKNTIESLNVGDRLYTPYSYLENAMLTRVTYDDRKCQID